MNKGILVLCAFVLLGIYAHVRNHVGISNIPLASAAAESNGATRIDFQTQIRPIFQGRCQPCHFNGGNMYARLPFDRAETIKKLGEKVFTRIKDQNDQRLIREFLAQQ
jgi:hypothetical protein